MKRRIIAIACLIMALLMLLPAANAEDVLRGYSKGEGYQYVHFGNYPYERDGTIKPALWKVLYLNEDRTALLITNFVIDAYPYQDVGVVDLAKFKNYRKITCLEESDLYPWMNTVMVDALFTPEEQNTLNADRGKLFLLDRDEFMITEYGFAHTVYGIVKTRITKATPYASKRGTYTQEQGATYWTASVRSPEGTQTQIVGYDGHMSWAGYGRRNVGIRPCVLVHLDQVSIASGNGTKDHPYVMEALTEEAK